MSIDGINKNSAPGGTDALGAKSGTQALGRDDFMKLLVAQLKNQDPNNPLDTKDLVTQLSQLTSVEQLVTIGEKMENLTSATQGMAANQSSGLIGRNVVGKADSVHLGSTGPVSGAVKFNQNADKATVSVRNEAGRVVQTFELDKKGAGLQSIVWDGKASTGERAPNGTYRFEIAALDKDGNPIESDQTISGLVSGVYYENGYPELAVGNTRVPLSNISSISQ